WGTSGAPLAGRVAELQRAVARLKPRDLFPYDRRTALDNGFIRQCLPWAPTPPTPLAAGKLRAPTLLVNGDHDLSTPPERRRPRCLDAARVGAAGVEARSSRQARRRARSRSFRPVAGGQRRRPPRGRELPAVSLRWDWGGAAVHDAQHDGRRCLRLDAGLDGP